MLALADKKKCVLGVESIHPTFVQLRLKCGLPALAILGVLPAIWLIVVPSSENRPRSVARLVPIRNITSEANLRRVKRALDDSVTEARPGRPRDRQIDVAVLRATLAALDESGYGGLTLEEVARRAGTTKPAIYRRWPSRQRLVLSALGRRLGEARAPDTGCTLCDLDECLKVFVAAFRRMPPDAIGSLFADCAGDPELRAAFMSTLFDPPRAAVRETLQRARARGDLRDDVDIELILDLIGSLVHYRALFGHARTSNVEIERAVEALLQGIATDYPKLLEHSRQMSGEPKLHHLHASGRTSGSGFDRQRRGSGERRGRIAGGGAHEA
jgi:AcrR family transcriptional regulator